MGECAGEKGGDRKGMRERKYRLHFRRLEDAWSYLACCPQLTMTFKFLWVGQLQLEYSWNNEKKYMRIRRRELSKTIIMCRRLEASGPTSVANVWADSIVWAPYIPHSQSSQWWVGHPDKGNCCKSHEILSSANDGITSNLSCGKHSQDNFSFSEYSDIMKG